MAPEPAAGKTHMRSDAASHLGTANPINRLGSVMIAPAPSKNESLLGPHSGSPSQSNSMPYTCRTCVRRKVKCDRTSPVCSSCTKAKLECVYVAPPPPQPRRRKRSTVGEDLRDRLAQYERILEKNGLLPTDIATASPVLQSTVARALPHNQPLTRRPGKLLTERNGESRYIGTHICFGANEVGVRDHSETEEDDQDDETAPSGPSPWTGDPLSGMLFGNSETLANYHPSHRQAMKLWAVHIMNVEPLCKVLHIPTTARLVESSSQQPSMVSKATECLLFAIYHFAVFSMADEECVHDLGQPRAVLLDQYQHALRQALVNASWLKTFNMTVMQAYVLYLLAMRTQTDPHTFWILTGVGIRIAQRMGLHRDGESLGLPPFEVQMRRRLFWQLAPLDNSAGQFSKTAISIGPNEWDTKRPYNINDSQIYPNMIEHPKEQKGASEMIYCLAKIELADFYVRTAAHLETSISQQQLQRSQELDQMIDKTEDIIESKYLRYCDIVNPLHVLTLGVARSAGNSVRLRNRIRRFTHGTIYEEERQEMYSLARKILDTVRTVYRNSDLSRFRWQIGASFLRNALVCVLTGLAKPGLFISTELDEIWKKIEELYSGDDDILLHVRGILRAAVAKATIEAWIANPPSDSISEPAFITALKTQNSRSGSEANGMLQRHSLSETEGVNAPFDPLFANIVGMDFNFGSDFDLDTSDWLCSN